ncbi:MAG: PAS domain-containing protein, partial [Deltaproteobacteria bacterium]|nr:PAS domain-containing protein [Deltaproteobacteria bacterium]
MKTLQISTKVVVSITIVLAIIGIFVHLSYLCHRDFEETAISQTQQRLLTIAKTTASRLEEFVETLSRESKVIAAEPAVQEEIKDRIMQTQLHVCPIKIFYESHIDVADALTTLDANGIMLHRHPFWRDKKDRTGTDFTDKPGVAYVVREHEPHISKLFYNNLGEPCISISEPVFYKDEFIGIVRWMISLENLYKRFIQPVKVGEAGFAWILDERGTLLSYPDPNQVGKHIMAPRRGKFPDHDWALLEEIVNKSTRGEEGSGIYGCATCGKRIIAYAPVHIGNRLWSIGVSMNYSEIASPIFQHAMHHVEITALVMLLFSAGGFAFYRTERKRSNELKNKNIELMQEITERKRAENALRESETQKQAILDASVDSIALVDTEMRIVWANKTTSAMVNKTPDDLVGHTCHKLLQNLDTPCPGCPCKKALETGNIEYATMYQPAMDVVGESYWEDYGVPVKDESGQVVAVIEIARNVTEKMKAEKARLESEEKLAGVVGSVTDLMFMVDEQFNIVWTNDVAKDMFGPDMVGKKCYAVYHGRDKICESCIVRQCFEDDKVHEFETEMTTSDGSQRSFWCMASVAARYDDGRPRMVVESLRDITDRKRAEEKVRASLREKEVLLREIHHRVKNNMQVISSLLKLQSKYIRDEKDVEMFIESQNRIKSMALVHEKLYQSEDLANIDFNEYVKHLANILFRSYGIDTGKIALKLDIEDVIIEVDTAIPCGLIVNELVSNSLKYAFTEDGKGEVKITLHSTDENEMELTVSDDGVGIPKDLDFRNTESLGLKLVNILTSQIRGRWDLERSKGSKFHI